MPTAKPKSPYDILGVPSSASADEIRAAYRRLAKKHHPDANPGKPDAAETFAAISSAYALLSDTEKRARFDRGELDAAGNEARPQWRDFSQGAGPSGAGFAAEDLEDLLRHAMGARAGARARQGFASRGEDARYTLAVPFLEAALGAKRRITLPDGKSLDVSIPPGHADGQVLRLRGQGHPGTPPGDALIEVAVTPHRFFRREGDDIHLELPVTIQEAILGAKVEVPTLTGKVALAIPPHSGPGTRLRLRNRGLNGGHQYVTLAIALPPEPEPALEEFLRSWAPAHPHDPRRDLEP